MGNMEQYLDLKDPDLREKLTAALSEKISGDIGSPNYRKTKYCHGRNEDKGEDAKVCISCESYDVCLAAYIECTRMMVDSEVRRMLSALSKIGESLEDEEPSKEEAIESLKRLVDMCGESFCDIGNVVQNGLLGKE